MEELTPRQVRIFNLVHGADILQTVTFFVVLLCSAGAAWSRAGALAGLGTGAGMFILRVLPDNLIRGGMLRVTVARLLPRTLVAYWIVQTWATHRRWATAYRAIVVLDLVVVVVSVGAGLTVSLTGAFGRADGNGAGG